MKIIPDPGVHNKLYEGTDWSGNDADFTVYIYPNSLDAYDEAMNIVAPAIHEAAQQLLNWQSVSYYNIYLSMHESQYPEIGKFLKSNAWDKFGEWLEDTGLIDLNGCHLLVSNSVGGGYADAPRLQGGSAFVNGNKAVTTTMFDGGVMLTGPYAESLAIQEVLHTYIRHDYSRVTDMIRSEDDPHDFGTTLNTGFCGTQTPMAAHYNYEATRGECSSGVLCHDSHTNELTSCTKDAVKYTAEKDADSPDYDIPDRYY